MPEAAEVKRMVDALRRHCETTVITTGVVSGRYARNPIKALDSLAGFVLKSVFCRGKCIFMRFIHPSSKIELWGISTLGLTGEWRIWRPGGVSNSLKRNEHFRFFISLSDGYDITTLEYHDQRNFGTFKLGWKKQAAKKHLELGPEPISLVMTSSRQSAGFAVTFPEMLEVLGVPGGDLVARARKFGKKHTVATALLDQRIFCGVGNYIRADACYTAKIDPRLPLSSLDEGELHRLFRSCGEVAAAAYMEPARFVNTCYQRKTSPKGNPIESYVDATGRTMWWCPAEQASPHL